MVFMVMGYAIVRALTWGERQEYVPDLPRLAEWGLFRQSDGIMRGPNVCIRI
jgi:hypothetical protein